MSLLKKYITVVLCLVTISPTSSLSALTVQQAVNSLQATDPALPSGVANPKGSIGYILSSIFGTVGNSLGKIQAQYIDYSGISTWTQLGANTYLTTTTGSVGIGTISPAYKLDVLGIVNATAFRGDGSVLTGITPSQIGLGLVNNTSDANKPVSIATQTILDLKANLASPSLTGTPTAPTPLTTDSSTTLATTAFVKGQSYITSAGSPVQSVSGRTWVVTLSQADIAGLTTASSPSFNQIITSNNGNGTNYRIGDDSWLGDINVTNTAGIYGVQDSTVGSIKLGSNGGTVSGYNGNVGVGTTTPGYKLDVAGNVRFASWDNSYAYFGPNASWGGQLYVWASWNRATTNTAQVIATDGNLHLDSGNNGKAIYMNYYSQTNSYINPQGGNVGIGNVAPAYKLDVTGDMRVTGTIYGNATSANSVPWSGVTGKPNLSANNFQWNWSGQWGQPTWLWGWADGTNMYVYNPSNFSVNYANSSNVTNLINGVYTGGGWLQAPSYIPNWQVRFNMMAGVPGTSNYQDWMLMDTYSWGDVPYVTGIWVSKVGWTPNGYLISGAKGGGSWTSTPIITGGNIGSQSVNYAASAGNADTVDGYHASGLLKWNTWDSGNYYQTNGDIYMGWAGNWVSTILAAKATHRGEGTNYVDYSRYVYNNGAYSGWGWVEPSDLWVRYAASAGNASTSDKVNGYGSSPNNSHPGTGLRPFYSWNIGQANNATAGYSNGISVGSNPGDQSYGFQIVQNMWDDRLYFRRYNAGWQWWLTVIDSATIWSQSVNYANSAGSTPALTGSAHTNGSDGWFRSAGNAGWFNETYGWWMYMTDTTWVRAYNWKSIWTSGTMQADTNMYSPAYYYSSDKRLKDNIVKIDGPLEKIEKLNGYTFEWKKDWRKDIWVIAQEVEKVFPQIISTNKDWFKTVEYGNLVAPLIEAVKELATKVEGIVKHYTDQQKEIDTLTKQNEQILKRLEILEKKSK